jgi:hypothetical protein
MRTTTIFVDTPEPDTSEDAVISTEEEELNPLLVELGPELEAAM